MCSALYTTRKYGLRSINSAPLLCQTTSYGHSEKIYPLSIFQNLHCNEEKALGTGKISLVILGRENLKRNSGSMRYNFLKKIFTIIANGNSTCWGTYSFIFIIYKNRIKYIKTHLGRVILKYQITCENLKITIYRTASIATVCSFMHI